MIRSPAPRTRRTGFTLVEVLIVIAIIAVLVALAASAVFKVIGRADEVVARKDMSDLALGIENFKVSMGGVGYIPSRFRLREDLYYYTHDSAGNANTDPLDIDSWSYLKKLFPKLVSPNAPNTVVINWVGDPSFPINRAPPPPLASFAAATFDLEGHQCLTFFLGGIPAGGNSPLGGPRLPTDIGPATTLGFSTNPTDPAQFGGDRIGPFYGDFKSNRLIILGTGPVGAYPNVLPATNNLYFFSYMDPWAKESDFNLSNLLAGKTPVYGYLSAYGKTNGYNRYFGYYLALTPPALEADNLGPTSDCASLVVEDYQKPGMAKLGLWPYMLRPPPSIQLAQYVNSTSYQIFTAGPNKVFGEGTRVLKDGITVYGYPWSTQTAGLVSQLGKDDFSNFHDRPLGSGD
jgi:prepilin-type N-terminal cleavage/methylation domain-containing protein